MTKLRAAVIGVGYLGSHHVDKFLGQQDVDLIGVVDKREDQGRHVGVKAGVDHYTDFHDILDKVELVSVVVPPEDHYSIAKACLEAGVHVFVEKPVTKTIEQADELIRIADQHRLVLQVGHLERFNPAVRALEGRLHDPMFIESHRLTSFRPRSARVDVVLDLMIHDIDIILMLARSEITDIRAIGLAVVSDDVDIVNARLEFASGCVANVTSSRVSRKPMRKIRVFQPDAYVSIDCLDRNIAVAQRRVTTEAGPAQSLIAIEQRSFEQSDALRLEIDAFVDAVKRGTKPLVSGADGKRALEVVLEINKTMRKRQRPRASAELGIGQA